MGVVGSDPLPVRSRPLPDKAGDPLPLKIIMPSSSCDDPLPATGTLVSTGAEPLPYHDRSATGLVKQCMCPLS